MKIDNVKIIADQNILYVREAFKPFGRIETYPARQITSEILSDASMLLVRSVTPVDKGLIEGNSSLRFVASATTGIDHVDTECLRDATIGFGHAPGSNANSVAEYIMTSIFHLLKKAKRRPEKMTIGVVGVGNVGSLVVKYADALGMKCLLNDPPKKKLTGSDMYVSLDRVLEESDIVTLHVPLTMDGDDATYHLANKEFFAKMKNGAIFMNASRGKVMCEEDLRFHRKKLGGVVLDVWENEPGINIQTLSIADIATPHIAGYSYDGKFKGTQMIFECAKAFFFKDFECIRDPEDKIIEISVRNSQDPVADVLEKAYRIMNDDEATREILKLEKDKRGAWFDDLRKNYKKRFEFNHFSITDVNNPAVATQLKTLGFLVS